MATIEFQATAAAICPRVRLVTSTSAAAAISARGGRGPSRRRSLGGARAGGDVPTGRARGRARRRSSPRSSAGGASTSGAGAPRAPAPGGRPGRSRSASVACTRRRSCSTQRRAVAQVDVEAAHVGVREHAVEAVGDQALGSLAPAAAAERDERLAQLFAGGGQQRAELGARTRPALRHLGARPLRQHHERERAAGRRVQRREPRPRPRAAPSPDRPGRAAGRERVAVGRAP